MHNRWSRGVVGAIPEGMGHHICKVWKWYLMQELICFSVFYITSYINSSACSYYLQLQGGGVAPLPPYKAANVDPEKTTQTVQVT